MGILILCFGIALIIGEVIRFIVEDSDGEPFFHVMYLGIGVFLIALGCIYLQDNDAINILRDKIQTTETKIVRINDKPVEMYITIEGEEYHIILNKDKVKKEN